MCLSVTKTRYHSFLHLWWRKWVWPAMKEMTPRHLSWSNGLSAQGCKRRSQEAWRPKGLQLGVRARPSDFLLDNIFAWAKNVTESNFVFAKVCNVSPHLLSQYSLLRLLPFLLFLISIFLSFYQPFFEEIFFSADFYFHRRQYRVFPPVSLWWRI